MSGPGPYRTSVSSELRRVVTNIAVPHNEPPAVVRRRRIVVIVTLVVGAVVLGLSLRRVPGQPAFYWMTLALAAVWIAGARVSGPLYLGSINWRGRNQRPVITGTVVGLLLGAAFAVGGLVAREIPAVSAPIAQVLQFAHHGSFWLVVVITVVNGVAEEMFFRGALYTALGRARPVLISTALYTCAALAGGNPMLGFAAIVLGTVCALERRATGGVLAPGLTHFVWGLIVVLVLPPMFGA